MGRAGGGGMMWVGGMWVDMMNRARACVGVDLMDCMFDGHVTPIRTRVATRPPDGTATHPHAHPHRPRNALPHPLTRPYNHY